MKDKEIKAMNNILLVGLPGVGKTAIVEEEYGDKLVKVLVSSMVEEDISGLPYREGNQEKRTEPLIFKRIKEASQKGDCCLFLDELDKGRQEVVDTLLTLVYSRKVGEWELPNNCQIIAACNPPEAGGGEGISEAMQTRFSVVKFEPCVDKFVSWLRKAYPNAENIAKAVESGELNIMNDAVGEGLDRRVTNPRTIEMAINAKSNSFATREKIIEGLVAPRAVSFFLTQSEAEKKSIEVALNASRGHRLVRGS